ncbi:BZ3500_MvSof-1268-A1-R1_Chr3-1g05604 [Microbotryum saponariae]|uniref:BZ3500_MvSof-1268-A1-R1_Chr3-1g05604 protein n=1 Tax=Microbotryum saponariae TaxID=289078 RepID=A0A2X0LCU2_9BASI|nr:BZ3500_MvSof-1268-A1-R1_Chr3-1g05604 [Microbotryum saponariae]SDA04794.1 BZ3501_MvSof-1269-A2-R1_Chr3-1g05274 [Microbotryum saponariae]
MSATTPSKPARTTAATAASALSTSDTVVLLLQHICRTFYDTEQSILVDSLRRKSVLSIRDDELAGMMLMQKKDVAAVAKRLIEDQLLSSFMRREAIEGTTKSFTYKRKTEAMLKGQKLGHDDGPKMQNKTYYYIDPSKTTDNIKWRLYQVRKVLDDQDRNELDAQGYFCPLCKAEYTHLDAGGLLDFARNVLACSICGTEVVDKETIVVSKSAHGNVQKFIEQTKTVSELLRSIEEGVLPRFDIEEWLAAKDADKARNATHGSGDSHRLAHVNVQIAGDEDEEIERLKREAEKEEKRQQNQLPTWIANSTVTGEAREAPIHHPAQSDDTKPRLGLDARSSAAAEEGQPTPTTAATVGAGVEGESHAGQDPEEDDLDAYYARMVANNAPPPTATTTSVEQSPLFSPLATPAALEGSATPVAATDSPLPHAVKRAREDTDGSNVDDRSKKFRVEDVVKGDADAGRTDDKGGGGGDVAGGDDHEDDDDDDDDDEVEDPNPLITVGDLQIAFDQITEAHTEAMIYFDHYSRLG